MPERSDFYDTGASASETRRLGSIMLTIGWILLWMDGMLGVYFFISLRDGSLFWPIWVAIEGVLGLALIVVGTRYRHRQHATRLGAQATERVLRQQRQDEDEERHVT
jgi:hypothetical protein